MKKTLLSITTCIMTFGMSFGQGFTQAIGNTGFTYDCDFGAAQSQFTWSFWGPACSGSDNGGGGIDEAPVNELVAGWGQGGNGKMYVILTLTTPLNLSSTSDQKISMDLKADSATTYSLSFEDASNNSLLSATPLQVTTSTQTFAIDLTSKIALGADLSAVKKIIFIYDGCPSGWFGKAKLHISNFKVGSTLTGVNELVNHVSSSRIYPSPASSIINVELNLNQISTVKLTIGDVLGNQLKTIAQENTSSIKKAIDITDLSSGIYYVSYQVEGSIVRT